MVNAKRLLRAVGAMVALCTTSIGAAQSVATVDRGARQPAVSAARPSLTVVDSLGLRRFVDVGGDTDRRILRSPDGNSYLMVMAYGDLAANGTWVDFHIGTLQRDRPGLRRVARKFTRGFGSMALLHQNFFAWTGDSRRVAFIWEDERGIRQIALLDASSGAFSFVTQGDAEVLQFRASQDGQQFVFTALSLPPPAAADPRPDIGTVVETTNFDAVAGNVDSWQRMGHAKLYSVRVNEPVRQISLPPYRGGLWFDQFEISPDGNYAALPLPVASAPDEWQRYRDHYLTSVLLPQVSTSANIVSTVALVDIRAGTATRPIEAPLGRTAFSWSADSRYLLVGPTYEPADSASDAGLEGRAILRIDPARAQARSIPLPADFAPGQRLTPTGWEGGSALFSSASKASPRYRYDLSSGTWSQAEPKTGSSAQTAGVRVVENLNSPPRVVWSSGRRERVMLDADPRLGAVSLAKAELIHWVSSNGVRWTGLFYLPHGRAQGTRSPLVIQMKPFSRTAFSVLGSDSYPSVFAAQVLAGRGIAVLQMGYPDPGAEIGAGSPREQRVILDGIESAIAHLSASGSVDSDRVGLVGFSRTGYHVEYAISHSRTRFAAAIAADNVDYGYFQAGLAGWTPGLSANNGADPLHADGLRSWLEEAPAFNADRIETPLRLHSNNGSTVTAVLRHWEMFSRLKALNRPVELFLVPDLERGMHNLENPRQLLASRGGAVDWLLFWLLDEERAQPVIEFGETPDTLHAQYTRWRELRAQRDALVARRPAPQ
jgi:dipeptidyl aminopeptidase/acylaminoacyl peptidase